MADDQQRLSCPKTVFIKTTKGLLAAFNIKPIEILTPTDPDFSIVIPKIGANAKILKILTPLTKIPI